MRLSTYCVCIMSLSIGIVGLPNVGKSTFFNALTKKSVPAENYPFCTIDPSVGIVGVPDVRLDGLAKFSQSVKSIPAAIEFVDIAGLVEGASKGEGLGNKFLANIREVDAILNMVRLFAIDQSDGTQINHVYGSVDPVRDIKVILMELILADLETVEKRKDKNARDAKRGDKEAVALQSLLERLNDHLAEEELARTLEMSDDEKELVGQLHLLTMKPMIFGLNTKTDGDNINVSNPEKFKELTEYVDSLNAQWVLIDAALEHDLKDFEGDEKSTMRDEMGATHDGVDHLIRSSYDLLGLETYFTTGETESRAWTIEKGSTAPEAGSVIHTDFLTNFIKADVIHVNDLLSFENKARAREAGKIRLEGKDYIVQDGDVIEFKV